MHFPALLISLVILALLGSCNNRTTNVTNPSDLASPIQRSGITHFEPFIDSLEWARRERLSTRELEAHLFTEFHLRGAEGQSAILQSSGPRGGGYLDDIHPVGYAHPSGKNFGYTIYFHRVLNTGHDTLAFTLEVPADSIFLNEARDEHLRAFLLPHPLNTGAIGEYNYGLTGLKPYLDQHFNEDSRLVHQIPPGEALLFHSMLLISTPNNSSMRMPLAPVSTSHSITLTFQPSVQPFGTFACGTGNAEWMRSVP